MNKAIQDATKKKALLEKMHQLATEAGFSVAELMGGKRAGKGAAKASSVVVKYRNPENPDETWSGRGRMANWLKDKIAKRGVKAEDFLV